MTTTYHHDLEQGSQEWLDLRLGIITASQVKELVTPTGKVAKNEKTRAIAYQLAAERITKRAEPNVQTFDMERGHIEEELARDIYNDNHAIVDQCGFITSDDIGFTIGYSPDGLVGEDGLIEIKSRKAKFQIKTFCDGVVPSEYMHQCQTGMMITGRAWCDFVQYSNGMAMFVERVFPDEEMVSLIQSSMVLMESTVVELVEEYEARSKGCVVADYVQHISGQDIEVSE